MNYRFVVWGLLLTLPVALFIVAAGVLLRTPLLLSLVLPLAPTPPPPVILQPTGPPPVSPVGLRELTRYGDEDYVVAGSGFLLALNDGRLVGVVTAHSLSLDNCEHPLAQIALGHPDQAALIGEFATLLGQPGRPRTGEDMTVDYVLLPVDQAVAPELTLAPDPRGAPQPGERLALHSGVDGRVLAGTVQSATEQSIWVLMDDRFEPGLMSGSPLLSQHTGRVVGMAVAASQRHGRLLIGSHPIGSLVRLAESAAKSAELPAIASFCRPH